MVRRGIWFVLMEVKPEAKGKGLILALFSNILTILDYHILLLEKPILLTVTLTCV